MQNLRIQILRFSEASIVVFLCVLGGFARDSRSQQLFNYFMNP